jgi:predicted ATPase
VARVTGDKPLPAAIVEQIVARTDGVPLLLEELTKAVLESLAGLAGLAFVLYSLGYPEQAVARSREAVDDAKRSSHPAGLAYSLHHAYMFDQVRRDVQGVHQRAAALSALAAEHGFAQWEAGGVALEGWALVEDGRATEGIARIEHGIRAWNATGAAVLVPYYLGVLGSTYARVGRAAEALPPLTDAISRVESSEERWFEAELHRRRGEVLLLSRADAIEAETSFLKAIGIAQEQGAKLWELRAATSLARLWRDQGRRAEADHLLAPVYGWFTEGFDTPDLKEAKALLDDLA